MLRESAYYDRIIDSFGVRTACGVALGDAGRPDVIDQSYADLYVPESFYGQPVMKWLETLPEAECRRLLAKTLAEADVPLCDVESDGPATVPMEVPPLDHNKIASVLGSTFEPLRGDGMEQYMKAKHGKGDN